MDQAKLHVDDAPLWLGYQTKPRGERRSVGTLVSVGGYAPGTCSTDSYDLLSVGNTPSLLRRYKSRISFRGPNFAGIGKLAWER